MARKPKVYDDDDGHTIANMNVEGMPWYDRAQRIKDISGSGDGRKPMDRSQRSATILAVVLAALSIALVFGLGYFLVILLMDTLLR
jgi:hypothetical protein